ncbi:MerR family transcriptional regulator [Streptomyces sp. Z26]|uniref:MerR family transcriptional regulator n=1 Tax=Streptomyces sp. Z26 TaxID=2500177 RepID=UPI000EF17008|nr:MerR family transcriptional regulator [Streptomyces sp. Z26]RLL66013.1 MerR family transcriptional regulator [Streptomyces sp. Z26]
MDIAEVVAATGWSAQQIRDLEAAGVVPRAERAPNGYRRFTAAHVRDLRAYRQLAYAVGPVDARRALRGIRTLPPAEAVALLSAFHVRLAREREQALAARAALAAVSGEAATDAPPVEADAMTITELARALGVNASALRFWEREGLVAPERIATSAGTARRYPLAAIREARITVALRAAGYRVPEVREAVTALRELREVGASLAALDARLAAVGRRTLALLAVGAVLAEIVDSRTGQGS